MGGGGLLIYGDQHHFIGHFDHKSIFPLFKYRPWRDYSPQWQLVVKNWGSKFSKFSHF